MIRSTAAMALCLLSSAAFAQSPVNPPTDQEIAELRAWCASDQAQDKVLAPAGTPAAGKIIGLKMKPEFSAKCQTIQDESEKRQLDAKNKQQQKIDALDSALKRLKQ